MKLGSLDIANLKLGSLQVNEVRLGTNLVWQAFEGILDFYPTAAAGYSLRKLRANYTGASIEVRRSSDNATSDIGFTNNELDTVALLAFTGAGDGFVSKWYDQENSNDAVQANTAKQPQIVSSGSVLMSNGKPAIQSIANSRLDTPSISMAADRNIFIVTERLGASFGVFNSLLLQITTDFYQIYTPADNSINYYDGVNVDTLSGYLLAQQILTVSQDVSSGTIRRDGTEIHALTTGATALNESFALFGFSSYATNGYFSEVLIYPNDQAANIVGIETNINDFYTTF